MTETQRAATRAALEALELWNGTVTETDWAIDVTQEIEALRAALTTTENEPGQLHYEVYVNDGVDNIWVTGADSLERALQYARGFTVGGDVRVYEKRTKEIVMLPRFSGLEDSDD